ncbi:MAG: hypothetical protein CL589_21165 [Alteromonadaceae bacterium]|nr:hypothetical protein [Alteromonadaceae bacterium]MAX45116.1 hypothetical protein [Alteromonadaceae bacterium]|tara:strand:+ start:3073 stop:3978 length:906 start_codon:yes stop_codon:yes gene_type:complete
MATQETFTYLTLLGTDYQTDSNSYFGNYTVYDNSDGSTDGTTTVGSSITFYSQNYTFRGTTPNGIVIEYGGSKYLLSNTSYSPSTTLSVNTSETYVYCFLEGTQISTPDGTAAIETLKIGDAVVTSTGKLSKIRWMGHQTIHRGIKTSVQHEPVCISAHALGTNKPNQDLYLTGSHALLIDDVLINASALCNDNSIRYIPMSEMPESFTYWHIETDEHEAIIANGLAAETFVDAPDRRSFDNYQEYLDFYGVERIIPEMNIPRITDSSHLPDSLKTQLGITTISTDWAALVANSNNPLTLK